MAKIIEAKAVISAQDNTGAVFDRIAKKIEGIARSAKTSAEVDRLSKALARAQQQMAAIDRFGAARGGFADARARFREAQAAVESAAQAMKRGEGDARALQRAYETTRQAVSRASVAFERQKSAVLQARRSLDELGIPANRAAAAQDRLRAAVERTNAALERQAQRSARSAARREAIGMAGGLIGGFAAHGVKHGAGEVLHTYREFDRERRFGKAVMGLTDEEQAPLVKQAIHMGATTRYNDIQVLEAQRELAARGLNKNQIMGMIEPAAQLGMSFDIPLPDAVKQMEGAIFGFKKDTSTLQAAKQAAKQTADYQVKAAKLSGMTPEDIAQVYKFGATPARMGKISEATLLGFGGILKKANIGGDEAGVAFRALMAMTQAPTAGAKTALLASGLNYKNYQHLPDRLAVAPFADDVAARYGVKLNESTRAGLGSIFSNEDLIADPARFAPAVTALLRETLGGADAKSLKSIAGAATRYRDKSVKDIDADALIRDLLPKLANNLPLANALFGSKQGGRIATALGDGDMLTHIIDEIERHSGGYSDKISAERMSGFDGAVSRLEGAMKNLETAIGRAFDGPLTWSTDKLGKFIQGAAELPPWAVGTGAAGAVGVGGYGALKFAQSLFNGFGLKSSAAALDGSALSLTRAAAALSGAAGLPAGTGPLTDTAKNAAPPAAASILGGAALGAGAAAVATGGAIASVVATNIMNQNPEAAKVILDNVMLGAMDSSTAFASGILYAQYTAPGHGVPDKSPVRAARLGGMRRAWSYELDSVPEVSPTMTYPTVAPGKGFDGAPVKVSGNVTGEGKLAIEINAGSSLLDVVRRTEAAISLVGAINSNGPGSLGHSSPDAAAPSPAHVGSQGNMPL